MPSTKDDLAEHIATLDQFDRKALLKKEVPPWITTPFALA